MCMGKIFDSSFPLHHVHHRVHRLNATGKLTLTVISTQVNAVTLLGGEDFQVEDQRPGSYRKPKFLL